MTLDHLSASQAGLYLHCGLAWQFRYIDGIKTPPAGAMIRGTALDQAATTHYRRKASGQGLAPDAFVDAAVDAHRVCSEESEIAWDVPFGQSQDMVARAAGAYHREIGVKLSPRSEQDVQRRWETDLDGITIVGITDLITTANLVVDTKLKARMPSQPDLDTDFQLSTYAWLTGATQLSLAVAQPTGKAQMVFTERDQTAVKRVQLLYSRVAMLIASGFAHPAAPDSWWCGPNWCGFWPRCEFGGK
jgi:hypothetical protein